MKKNTFLLFISISIFSTTNAQIAFQGFGGAASDTWSYTATPAFYDLGNDYWHITTSTDNILADGGNGNFVGGEDLKNGTVGDPNYHTGSNQLTFAPISISGEEVIISFRLQYIGYDDADYLHFEVNYDNGTNWDSPDFTNQINGIGDSTSSGGWINISHTVPPGNTHVRMRIDILQNGSDEIGLDGFKIENSNVLSTIENTIIKGLSYGPNPTSDIVTINANSIIEKVIIYNLEGKQVIEKSGSLKKMSIDLNDQSSGIYYMKVISDGKNETISVIKK